MILDDDRPGMVPIARLSDSESGMIEYRSATTTVDDPDQGSTHGGDECRLGVASGRDHPTVVGTR